MQDHLSGSGRLLAAVEPPLPDWRHASDINGKEASVGIRGADRIQQKLAEADHGHASGGAECVNDRNRKDAAAIPPCLTGVDIVHVNVRVGLINCR